MAEQPIDFRPLKVVSSVAGTDLIQRQRDLLYESLPSATLHMDSYRPAPPAGEDLPAVVLVHGDGPPEWLKDVKDWGQYVSWGELLAASGLVAITFNHRSTEGWTQIADAASDVDDLVALVRTRARGWNIDPDRLDARSFHGCCLEGWPRFGAANHAQGRHAFDVLDPGPTSTEIIARSIAFLRSRLLQQPGL